MTPNPQYVPQPKGDATKTISNTEGGTEIIGCVLVKPIKLWYKRYLTLLVVFVVVLGLSIIVLYGIYKPVEVSKIVTIDDPELDEDDLVPSGDYNGYDYVDMGLSVKWATFNVGANSPMGYGDYYAWGEVSTKDEYFADNSLTDFNSYFNFDIGGNSRYDVARYKWGSPWRLPSASEIDELVINCIWEWASMNGVKGYKVISKHNDNWIFLPAAGDRYESSLNYRDSNGSYWSGTHDESESIRAYSLLFGPSGYRKILGPRCNGFSVRPVAE